MTVSEIVSSYLEALGVSDNDNHAARGIERAIELDSVGMYRLIAAESEVAVC